MRGIPNDVLITSRLCEPLKQDLKVLSVDAKLANVKIEDYKEEEKWKYLYALPTSRRGIGPSWVIRPKRNKSMRESIKDGLKEIGIGLKKLSGCSDQWLQNMMELLKTNHDKITSAIEGKIPQKGCLLTIELDGKKGGDNVNLRNAFVKARLIERRKDIKGKGQCQACRKNAEVSPSIPFRFFALKDKPSFQPHGNEGHSWTIIPLCEECTKWLYLSQNVLDNQLTVRIAGKFAYLIPNFEPGDYEVSRRFLDYLWHFKEDMLKHGLIKTGESLEELFEYKADEYELFGALLDEYEWEGPPPFRSVLLVFYQPGRKFLFLHTTADILPANLAFLSRELKRIRSWLLSESLGKAGKSRVKWVKGDLEFVRLAWDSQKEGLLALSTTDLVDAILTQRPPRQEIFWSDVDKLLRARYLESISSQEFSVKKSIENWVIDIFIIWELLYRKSLGDRLLESTKDLERFWINFFADKPLLNSNAKRAYFLIGALFGKVEFAQREERNDWRGEMPIMNRLRGMTITSNEISTTLFGELKLKVQQLGVYSKTIKTIEEAVAHYLIQGGELSNEEARYCFALGWSLDRCIEKFVSEQIYTSKEETRGA